MKKFYIVIIFILINANISRTASPYSWDLVTKIGSYFMNVENLDSMNLMALGNNYYTYKYVIKSSDAGITWDTVYIETEDTVKHKLIAYDLAYPTKNFCIISCDSGIFIKSTDGGKTWKQTRTGYMTGNYGFNKVSMYDEKYGLISSTYDMIISHDGFESWDSVKLPERYMIGYHQMLSPEKIYLFCFSYSPFNQRFLKSYDGGKSWKEYAFPDPQPEFYAAFNMKFIDSLYGYIIGGEETGVGDNMYDRIFKTTDGGETWNKILDTLLSPPYGLRELDILDRENAIFVGPNGKIYWTHDGGNSFLYDYNILIRKGLPSTLYVSMLGKNTSIIVDYNGRILRSSLATDIGETIFESYYHIFPNPAEDYIEISFPPSEKRGSGGVLSPAGGGQGVDLRIFDILGIEQPTSPQPLSMLGEGVRIDISSLSPGVYFVRVGDVVQKFVKI